jgi:membrane protease YdiL (CAAX protease family)
MLAPLRPQIELALAEAAQSPLTSGMAVIHPWRRLATFVLLAGVLMMVMAFAVSLAITGLPGMRDQAANPPPLPDGPLSLIGESLQVVLFASILGGAAFGILLAAALTYRRPLKDFLWPRRRFDAEHLGIGFLAMACVCIITIPIYLAMGSQWDPPILDPQYLDHTRLIYVSAMVLGLLVAAAAEEVVCRGVLLRLTGLITRRPLILCLINGVVFSAIHLDPDPVAFVSRAVSGGIWTWAALRLGGLEFAIGAHLANNLIIALFWQPFSQAGVSQDSAWIDLAPEVLTTVIMLVIVERLARRYVDPAELPARSTA